VDPLAVRAQARPSRVGVVRVYPAVEVGEAHLARDRLEPAVDGSGIGVLQAPARPQVGVVHDDVRVGDVALVVVVVGDGNLEVGEALSRPTGREPPQAVERDAVPGIWGDDVVLVGACAPAPPWGVVPLGGATRVHGLVPGVVTVDGEPMPVLADDGGVEPEVVVGQRPAFALEVASRAGEPGVTRYRLHVWHGGSPGEEARSVAEGGDVLPKAVERALDVGHVGMDDGEYLHHVGGVRLGLPHALGHRVEGPHRLVVEGAYGMKVVRDFMGGPVVEDYRCPREQVRAREPDVAGEETDEVRLGDAVSLRGAGEGIVLLRREAEPEAPRSGVAADYMITPGARGLPRNAFQRADPRDRGPTPLTDDSLGEARHGRGGVGGGGERVLFHTPVCTE